MSAAAAIHRIFSLRDVTMNFGNVVAIRDVVFDVAPGEIVGLVGDNGAGKSTLVKIMNGFYSPSRGKMEFKGEPVAFRSPRDARRAGIETVYQDLALIPALSMWRNFFSPDEPVDILSGGERQALAIARARYFGGTVLLLDEPTSALSVKETEKVSEAVQIARNSGLGVVIIDYNIAHVHRICDRIVIMESGRIFKSVKRDDVTAEQVADLVAGRHTL